LKLRFSHECLFGDQNLFTLGIERLNSIHYAFTLRKDISVNKLLLYSTFILVFLLAGFSPESHGLESGDLLLSGAPHGRGPLAAQAVISDPVGAAFLFDGEGPDLFVRTGRFGQKKGLFLYRWSARGPKGEPIFQDPLSIAHPFDKPYPPSGTILQTGDGVVHGLWLQGATVVHTVFDLQAMAFLERGRIALPAPPRNPSSMAARLTSNGAMELFFEVSDGVAYRPEGPSGRSPDYRPYDGRGIWRGGMPYVALYGLGLDAPFGEANSAFRLLSPTTRDVRMRFSGIAPVTLNDREGLITGSLFGPLHFYAEDEGGLKPRLHVVGDNAIALRHPTIHPVPVAFPNGNGEWSDIIAGGEGALYWYRFTGRFTESGKPVYEEPTAVLEENAALFAGTLPVPNVVDWDGDGDLDIVAGNSEGFILFFENKGDNGKPKFFPGVPVESAGRAIHVQPGYRLDIQGPGEARWGYVCPTVVDWNQDGLLDIVMSDSTARHTYYENHGTPTEAKLAAPQPIYYDGLDLYGTWRVQPAAGLLDQRMAYIALDDDDDFHLYWQQDSHNVTDGFKLRLESDEIINANYLDAGGSGRLKIVLYDWDDDGRKDLIVGTPRHASVPNPETGLPQSLGKPGSAVLFLKNVGSNAAPRFQFPKLFAYRGAPIYLGQHACAPAIANFRASEEPGLLVGEEDGRFIVYDREHLSLVSPKPVLE
jgi:hypothetical protein